jgi:hypothetical protein
MFKNLLSSHREWKNGTGIFAFMKKRQATRIIAGEPTEFTFCKRTFGAVILDASESGMKLACEIKLVVGSIIHLVDPAVTGKIVWRDDKNNLIGITFIKASPVESEWSFVDP